LIGVVQNYDVCPIVFNVYEQLKAELWHDLMKYIRKEFLATPEEAIA